VAAEDVGEQLFTALDAVEVAVARAELARREAVEPCRVPHPVAHLHDERAHLVVIRVAVDLHDPVRGLGDVELERVEDQVGAEPHVLAAAYVDLGGEDVGEGGPGGAVGPVRRDHQVVRAGQLAGGRSLGTGVHDDAELTAPLPQDPQQPPPAHRGEPVPAGGDDLAPVVDVDVVPAGELGRHGRVHGRVGVLDAAERLIGEHHAEAEGVGGRVALPHGDLVLRAELLHQNAEVQAAWAAADAGDAQCYVVWLTVVSHRSSRSLYRCSLPVGV
jgi:hypothetical protein